MKTIVSKRNTSRLIWSDLKKKFKDRDISEIVAIVKKGLEETDVATFAYHLERHCQENKTENKMGTEGVSIGRGRNIGGAGVLRGTHGQCGIRETS